MLFGLIGMLLLVAVANAQVPGAAFTASPTSGCLSSGVFSVSCVNQSTNFTSISFDYGDGSPATSSPNHIYTKAGTFTITLTATNASGSSTATHSVTILPQPTAVFSSNTTSGCFPLTVQFNDMSTTTSGAIAGWTWDFGDGSVSNDQNPSHLYTSSGSFPRT